MMNRAEKRRQLALQRRWLETRPRVVRETLTRWPLDSVVTDGMSQMWVIGASEAGNLLVSPINPQVDHDASIAAKRTICSGCLTKGLVHTVEQPHADE